MLKLFIMFISNILKKLNSRETRLFPKINTLTKIVFTIFIVFTISILVKNALAADNIIQQTQEAQHESNNAESWNLNSWNTTAVNALTSLTGEIPFTSDGNIDASKYQVSGLIGTSTKMVASFFNPQASGIQYVAQLKDNFLGKNAYAQGVAFSKGNSLQPLLPLWKTLRNVIYVMFSVAFVVIGIMIMLRVKISQNAVITIQTAIPKLIASLILVTFSYAIAGLVIDLSYWVQSFALSLLFSAKGIGLNDNLFTQGWTSLNVGDLIPGQNWFNFKGLSNANFIETSMIANQTVPAGSLILISSIVVQVVVGTFLGGAGSLLGSAASGGLNYVGGIAGGIIGAIGGVILMLILFILVAIWLIQLFFGLLTTYVSILIQIVTAPFIIGMGAIPNSKINFSTWLTELIAKVAVFPVVLIALVFINVLTEIPCGQLWSPALLDTGTVTAIFGNQCIIAAAIGLAGLAMVAKLPKLVPEAIFMIKPSAFGKAIGEGLSQNFLMKQGSAVANVARSNVIDNTGGKWFGKIKTNRIISQSNTQAAGEGNKSFGTAPPRKAPESKVTAEKTETSRNQ